MSPSPFTVKLSMARLSSEGSGMPMDFFQHVVLRRHRKACPAPLIQPIQETVEYTGVRLKEDREATVSTSLSLACLSFYKSPLLESMSLSGEVK